MLRSRVRRILLVGLVAIALQGCDGFDLFMALITGGAATPLEGTPAEGVQILGTLFQHVNAVAASPGTVEFSGNLVPAGLAPFGLPAPPNGGLPPTLRLIVQRKSGTGEVLTTLTFDLLVTERGAILAQSFPLPAVAIGVGQQMVVSVQPLGAALPESTLDLRVRYRRN